MVQFIAAMMNTFGEVKKSLSEQDISEPITKEATIYSEDTKCKMIGTVYNPHLLFTGQITLVNSTPVINLKSILKSSNTNGRIEATESGPPIERKVQWQPQVEVIYYAGDSVVGITKEDLSEEMDQLARKAAYSRGYTRIQPRIIDRAPFLDEVDLLP